MDVWTSHMADRVIGRLLCIITQYDDIVCEIKYDTQSEAAISHVVYR